MIHVTYHLCYVTKQCSIYHMLYTMSMRSLHNIKTCYIYNLQLTYTFEYITLYKKIKACYVTKVTYVSCYIPCYMTCYIAVWKINVIHNIIVWMCYITCYIWFKSGAPPPPNCACARICSKLKAKRVLFIYSSSARPSASTPFKRPPHEWQRPSMFFLVVSAIACSRWMLKVNNHGERYMQKFLFI